MSARPKWNPEWDALLGKKQDVELAEMFHLHPHTVAKRRRLLGIKRTRRKKQVPCAGCKRLVYRYGCRTTATCKDCRDAYRKQWRQDKAEHIYEKTREWIDAHREQVAENKRRWRAEHLERARKSNTEYARKKRQAARELLASLPCLECGDSHSEAKRHQILFRMLPCTTWDIHDAYPCIWGPGGKEERCSKGTQRLLRDLKKIGAVKRLGSYSIQQQRAA